MNAKETLKKIAEALNIAGGEPIEEVKTEVKAEVEAETVETKAEVEEIVTEVAEEVKAEAEVVEEPTKEAEAVVEVTEVVQEPTESDKRVAELENQLNDLKKLLKDAMATPEVPEMEIKQEDPKGLTHSPEKTIRPQHTKIGNKGKDTLSRVFKYINN